MPNPQRLGNGVHCQPQTQVNGGGTTMMVRCLVAQLNTPVVWVPAVMETTIVLIYRGAVKIAVCAMYVWYFVRDTMTLIQYIFHIWYISMPEQCIDYWGILSTICVSVSNMSVEYHYNCKYCKRQLIVRLCHYKKAASHIWNSAAFNTAHFSLILFRVFVKSLWRKCCCSFDAISFNVIVICVVKSTRTVCCAYLRLVLLVQTATKAIYTCKLIQFVSMYFAAIDTT